MTKFKIYTETGGEDHATKKPRLDDEISPTAVNETGAHFAFGSPSDETPTKDMPSQSEFCHGPEKSVTSDKNAVESSVPEKGEEVEDDNPPSAEQDFEGISAQMRQSAAADTKDLEIYEKGSTMRREAMKRLALEFSQFEKGLENNLENYALQEVVQKYDQICVSNDAQEEKIRTCFLQNHSRRTKLLATLQSCDQGWKQCSENMFHRINGHVPEADSGTDSQQHTPEKECGNAQNDKENEDGSVQEPDWQALKAYEPSQTDIECFLAGRHLLQLAQERFCQAYEEVQRDLISINDEATKILVASIDSLDVPMNRMENQLQYLLADNFVRRQGMEKKIQEAAQMQQGMFQTLMSRIAMKD